MPRVVALCCAFDKRERAVGRLSSAVFCQHEKQPATAQTPPIQLFGATEIHANSSCITSKQRTLELGVVSLTPPSCSFAPSLCERAHALRVERACQGDQRRCQQCARHARRRMRGVAGGRGGPQSVFWWGRLPHLAALQPVLSAPKRLSAKRWEVTHGCLRGTPSAGGALHEARLEQTTSLSL